MAEPYVGEIRIVSFNFAPVGWFLCAGGLQPISQYSALFELIGTTYGGDGQTTFGLPDLRGRVPLHQGSGFILGQMLGEEAVTLQLSQLPLHTHVPQAAQGTSLATGNPVNSPANNYWSGSTGGQYSNQAPTLSMSTAAVALAGNSQAHNNMPPYQTINYIMAWSGIFPSQS